MTDFATDGKPEGDPKLGESQGKPGDEDTVPKKQFLAAIKSVSDKADAAERRAQEASAELARMREERQQAQEKKPATLQELKKFVESGELSQDQADAIWEKQITDKATAKAIEATQRTIHGAEHQRRVESELSGYRETMPDAWVEGTPERAKVAAEFKHLVEDLGYPATRETDAVALRAAFGDLQALRTAKSTVRSGPSDTHVEVGGGKPAGSGKSDTLKLTPDQKKHYERQIENGIYAGWDAVREELKFAKPRR